MGKADGVWPDLRRLRGGAAQVQSLLLVNACLQLDQVFPGSPMSSYLL